MDGRENGGKRESRRDVVSMHVGVGNEKKKQALDLRKFKPETKSRGYTDRWERQCDEQGGNRIGNESGDKRRERHRRSLSIGKGGGGILIPVGKIHPFGTQPRGKTPSIRNPTPWENPIPPELTLHHQCVACMSAEGVV